MRPLPFPWADGFHSAWANTLVRHLNLSLLPPQFRAFALRKDCFEVRVSDESLGGRVVAAIELASPANMNRPESPRTFATKSASYLQQYVGLIVVDVVTSRHANLHREMLEMLQHPRDGVSSAELYSVAYRRLINGESWRIETWPVSLAIGDKLPVQPLWLGSTHPIRVDLEASYQETCGVLRIR